MKQRYFLLPCFLMLFIVGISLAENRPRDGITDAQESIPWDKIEFTPEEKVWLAQKHKIRVRVANVPPYQFWEKGPRGIAVDYLNKIATHIGFDLKFHKSDYTWPEALRLIQKKEKLDVHLTIKQTPERKNFIAFTKNYLFPATVIFTRDNAEYVGSIKDLYGKTVAVEHGYVMHKRLKNEYPQIKLLLRDNTLSALQAVSTNQAEAYIGNMPPVIYLLQRHGLLNIKVAAPSPFENHNMAMGIRKDWPELASIISKGIEAMPQEEQSRIEQNWLSVSYEYGVSWDDIWRWGGGFGGLAVLVLAVLLFMNRRLQNAHKTLSNEMAEHKRTSDRLRVSEERSRSWLEHSPVCTKMVDLDFNLQYMSAASIEALKVDDITDFYGKPYPFSFYPESFRNAMTKNLEKAKKTGEVITQEESVVDTEGNDLWFHSTIVPVKDDKGRIEYIIVVSIDTTERKRAEEALVLAKEAAESANRAKSEFLANMSHEVRTPLNGVMGMLQILQESFPDSEQKEDLETALMSGKNLTRILSDILDLSRIEAGKLDVREEEVIIGELMNSTQGAFMNEAAQKGLALTCHINPGLPTTVLGDSGRLRQIMFNLVGNAVKFTEQGEVNVRAYPERTETKTGHFKFCLEVSDTGIGIPKDKLELIYEPFSQVDGSYTRKFGGTGLGLSIVKRLVALMDGELHVESKVGVGTTFRVRIPVKAVEGEPTVEAKFTAAVVAPEEGRPLSKLHILLAEDDLSNQLVAKRMLEKLGHTVTYASTGKEALTALEKEPFDLIFMDVQMPEMDGTEATMEIRKDERFKDLPIIALTAHAMSGDRERFLEAGMNDYLAKPIDIEELKRVLAGVMKM